MQIPFSVVIITKNEERNISDAINSALFADEVVLVDSGSSDLTCVIAKKLGVKVIHQKWLGFGSQKNYAVSAAKNDWVFVLDADERITTDLRIEILQILQKPEFKAYSVARLNHFFGKEIKYCGLYPDYSIRLFNRKSGRFNEVNVHESFQTKEPTSTLQSPMLHLAYENVREFRTKQKKYASLSTKKPNLLRAIISPIYTFIKIYILRLGFLEGWRGLVIAFIYAEYSFLKYTK